MALYTDFLLGSATTSEIGEEPEIPKIMKYEKRKLNEEQGLRHDLEAATINKLTDKSN